MKAYLCFILPALALSVATTGCHKGEQRPTDSVPDTVEAVHATVFDSAQAAEFGSSNGLISGIDRASEIQALRQLDPTMEFNSEAYVEGVSKAVGADADNLSYFHGIEVGTKILSELRAMNQHGITVDRQRLLEVMDYYLRQPNLSAQDSAQTAKIVNALMTAER